MFQYFIKSPRSPEGGQSKKETFIIILNKTIMLFLVLFRNMATKVVVN